MIVLLAEWEITIARTHEREVLIAIFVRDDSAFLKVLRYGHHQGKSRFVKNEGVLPIVEPDET